MAMDWAVKNIGIEAYTERESKKGIACTKSFGMGLQ
jgi:hypothetical protein